MMLNSEVELIDGEAIAYVRPLRALVMADLHLGYESVMAKRGALLPHANLRHILKAMDSACAARNVSTIIVDGDIKNDFSTVDEAEFNELYDFANHAKELGIRLVLVKGNHDNFVDRYRDAFKLEIHRQETKIGDYLFFHGEEMPKGIAPFMIMGHEHPAIGIRGRSGKQEKLKCFLLGKYHGSTLLVLPAMNYFSSGTAVNLEPKSNLLAPIFSRLDVDTMEAIAVGYGSTMSFGSISALKRLR